MPEDFGAKIRCFFGNVFLDYEIARYEKVWDMLAAKPSKANSNLFKGSPLALSSVRSALGGLKHGVSRVLVSAIARCPQHYRFKLALRLVPFVLPFRVMHWRYKSCRGIIHPIDGRNEDVLSRMLEIMKRFNVLYEPSMTVQGGECIPAQGAIIINAHFCLNFLMARWLIEHGRSFCAVMSVPADHLTVPGTDIPLKTITADVMAFENMKRHIASGNLVVVYIDAEAPFKGCHTVETPVGPRYLSVNMMKFAANGGIPVVYVDTRLERRKIVTTFKRLESTTAEGLLDEFTELMMNKIKNSAHY